MHVSAQMGLSWFTFAALAMCMYVAGRAKGREEGIECIDQRKGVNLERMHLGVVLEHAVYQSSICLSKGQHLLTLA